MNKTVKASFLAALSAISVGTISPAAFAKTQVTYIEPFLCSSSGASKAGFVNYAGKKALLDVVLNEQGDYAGALLGGFTSFTASGSTVEVMITPTSTSSNLGIYLAVAGTYNSKTDVFSMAPSSVANKGSYLVYTFSFDRSSVPSTAVVKKLAVYAIQNSTASGNVYFDSVYLNETLISKKDLQLGTCLSY